jgi:hypothetical protein
MKKPTYVAYAVILCTLGLPLIAFGAKAADNPTVTNIFDEKANDAKVFSFDYGIPNSPALTLAGLAGSKLAPSTSLKPFVLSLPGLIGSDSAASSAAFDFAPAWALDPEQTVSEGDYRNNPLYYRTRFGLAIYKGDTGSGDPKKAKGSRIAIGISTSLLDSSDPLAVTNEHGIPVWQACQDKEKSLRVYEWFKTPDDLNASRLVSIFNAAITPPVSRPSEQQFKDAEAYLAKKGGIDTSDRASLQPEARLKSDLRDLQTVLHKKPPEIAALDTEAAKAIDRCQKEASVAAQHGASINLGAGVVWSGDAGAWKNFKDPNAAVWIAVRYPLGAQDSKNCGDGAKVKGISRLFSCWMVGGTGRYSVGEFDATGNSAKPQFKANVVDGWVGLERITSGSMLGGYYGYLDQHAAASADSAFSRSRTQWKVSGAISLDFIQDGLWIEGSYGAAEGSISTLNDKVALLSLSFGPPKIGSTFASKDTSGN